MFILPDNVLLCCQDKLKFIICQDLGIADHISIVPKAADNAEIRHNIDATQCYGIGPCTFIIKYYIIKMYK